MIRSHSVDFKTRWQQGLNVYLCLCVLKGLAKSLHYKKRKTTKLMEFVPCIKPDTCMWTQGSAGWCHGEEMELKCKCNGQLVCVFVRVCVRVAVGCFALLPVAITLSHLLLGDKTVRGQSL